MNFEQKLKNIIANISMYDIEINENTILTTDLGFDSVHIIELIVEIENEFNIEIDNDDLDIDNITVYGRLYNMIREKINSNIS